MLAIAGADAEVVGGDGGVSGGGEELCHLPVTVAGLDRGDASTVTCR
jgi:hypothetical protein